jgi:hypothetical protein
MVGVELGSKVIHLEVASLFLTHHKSCVLNNTLTFGAISPSQRSNSSAFQRSFLCSEERTRPSSSQFHFSLRLFALSFCLTTKNSAFSSITAIASSTEANGYPSQSLSLATSIAYNINRLLCSHLAYSGVSVVVALKLRTTSLDLFTRPLHQLPHGEWQSYSFYS